VKEYLAEREKQRSIRGRKKNILIRIVVDFLKPVTKKFNFLRHDLAL
jgi:hypothetical protein